MSGPNPNRGGQTAAGRFFGWLLVVSGALITLVCGSCTLTLVSPSFSAARADQNTQLLAVIALFIGGIPTLAGLAMAATGALILRRGGHGSRHQAETFD
ncbi:MAG TPA: hypothetical protein VME40_05140 [Caulobacteraceae bacterium]|nr:hypothetical protein [Caulobacteraceae bacterium]